MKYLASALVVSLLALSATIVSAQDRYGDAVVEQGELIVVRQGNNLKFNQAGQPVPVFVQDVLRVGENSRVVLKTREKSTIAMGANAVFQVRPFQYQEKQGFARMLFGRFRSVVQGLTGSESVNAKTATAVIGVKGTENFASIRPRGDTMLVGVEKVTTIQSGARGPGRRSDYGNHIGAAGDPGFVRAANTGDSPDFILIPTTGEPLNPRRVQDSNETPIGPDFLGLTLGDKDVISGPAPEEVLQELERSLDSPPPGSSEAGSFPGQQGLIRAGLTTESDLDEGESEEVEAGAGGAGGEQARQEAPVQNPSVESPNLDDPAQNLFRGDVQIQFTP